MSRLVQITPEEMPEVLRRAQLLQARESEEGFVEETVAAAEEVGVPRRYLERAADELVAEKQCRQVVTPLPLQRRRSPGVAIVACIVAAIPAVLMLSYIRSASPVTATLSPPLPPVVQVVAEMPPPAPVAPGGGVFEEFTGDPLSRWSVQPAGSGLSVESTPEGRLLRYREPAGRLVRLVRLPGPPALANRHSLGISLEGKGVGSFRIVLRGIGPERWRSAPLTIGPGRTDIVAPISGLRYEVQTGQGGAWKPGEFRPPDYVDALTLEITPKPGATDVDVRLHSLATDPQQR